MSHLHSTYTGLRFKLINKKALNFLLILIGSILFNLLFLLELSPFYSTFHCNDGGCFFIIAKAWADGFVPYLDYFDHKGPVFYLFYVLSYWIAGTSKWGTLLLWSILFSWVLWMLKCISGYLNVKRQVFYVALTIFLLYYIAFGYSEGYCTEIISLPFQVLPILIFTRCLNQKKGWHSFKDVALYGVAFGILILIRPNNACINAGILISCIVLYLKNSWYKDLFYCALSFLLGLLAIAIPVIIYFLFVGGLSELYYCYLEFNLLYKTSSAIQYIYSNSIRIIPILTACLFTIIKSRNNFSLFWLAISMFISALIIGLVFITGFNFLHYFLILSPLAFVTALLSIDTAKSLLKVSVAAISICALLYISNIINFSIYRLLLALYISGLLFLVLFNKNTFYIGVIISLLLPLYDFILSYPYAFNEMISMNDARESACKDILNIIPKSDFDKVYCDEAFNYEFIFQIMDSHPVNKYFNLPTIVLLNVDPTLESKIEMNFKGTKPKWILTSNNPTKILKKYIRDDYTIVDSVKSSKFILPLYIYNRAETAQ